MKSYLIRPACVLAVALGLASCGGGGDDNYAVAGSVDGIVYPGLVLLNNGGSDLPVAPPAKPGDAVSFSFANKLEYGDTYNVTIKNQPLHQTCAVHRNFPLSASDTAGRLAAINVRMECFINDNPIGGKVTGLTKDNTGLVVANGSTSGTVSIIPSTTDTTGAAFDYTMPIEVFYGETYGVTIVTQPVGRRCTIENPTGTMGDVAITNININCVPST
ncbi:hypothetical protein [Massilia yuzhufengensis]|uniref:Lipoprotein n=1 Tax=Massilia yuzhufengensis TaxID=1164594 RepID=A0A1I1RYG2_9BURK|nr:hypothetical protein [Massilia yuzhufengensis]SFD36573.1 hypothetical protein SAMN05216204_12336 [Massilia yuzhufengensis]